MRLLTRSVMAAGALLAALGLLTPAQANAPAPVPCDPYAEMTRTVAEIGADLDVYRIAPIDDARRPWGQARNGRVTISPDAPCELVADITRHEWLHVLQRRAYGPPRDHYGHQHHVERIADCGSRLLGSEFTPYLDTENDAYLGECSDADMDEARVLIDNTR